MKHVVVAAVLMFMVGGPVRPLNAQQPLKHLYITEDHINSLISHTLHSEQFKIVNISSDPIALHVGIITDGFLVSYEIPSGRTYPPDFVYIWIVPKLTGGQITCTINKIRVRNQLLTQSQLIQPNPYVSDLNATPLCNLFLTPFFVGYGSSAQIVTFNLKYHMIYAELDGTISPNAMPPVVVAGCEVLSYAGGGLKLHNSPSLEAPAIVIRGYIQATLLSWKGDWLKINYQGTEGWISSVLAFGNDECFATYFNSLYAWETSDTP